MAVRSSFILVRWEMGRERRILKIAYMIRYLFGPLRFFLAHRGKTFSKLVNLEKLLLYI
jgi:hypothetical protein